MNVWKLFGDVIIDLRVHGEDFDFYGNAEVPCKSDDDELQETAAIQIQHSDDMHGEYCETGKNITHGLHS